MRTSENKKRCCMFKRKNHFVQSSDDASKGKSMSLTLQQSQNAKTSVKHLAKASVAAVHSKRKVQKIVSNKS